MAQQALLFDGKKFMWDGREHAGDEEAATDQKEYADNGFEVRLHHEDGKTYLYTRRVITEVVVD